MSSNDHIHRSILQLLHLKFVICFFTDRIEKLVVYFGLYESSSHFWGREDQIRNNEKYVYEK